MKKEEFQKRADEFFKEETDATRVYFTSDGNMFRADHYAKNWATTLTDKTVTPFYKDGHEPTTTESQSLIIDTDTSVDGTGRDNAGLGDERADIIKRFVEKFDTKPIDGLSNEDLLAAIESGVEPVAPETSTAPANPVVEQTELQKLQARYLVLYGTKPNARTGEAKLKIQIAEKEAAK